MDDNDSLLDLQSLKQMIHHLSEKDLLMLNDLIVKRIKGVRAERKVQSMAAFEVGDAVFFYDKEGERTDATVLRLNKKTLSLLSVDGQRWNVAPELCLTDDPVTGDLFEHNTAHQAANVTVLPTAQTAQSAAKGRWFGGAIEMPAYVSEGGESYRPLVMMWIDADGLIAASEVCTPQSDLKQVALETLQQALHSPMTGKPQRPKYITVNDRDLADFLGSQVPGINIEHGDTPVLNDVFNNMQDMMPPGDAPDTYLSTGLSAGQISTFFDATAAMYRSAPWEYAPHDACLLEVNVESLGIRNAVLSVIGQHGQTFGFVVYADFQQYCQYQIASDRMKRGLDCDIPAHTALSFDEGAEVSTAVRKEIAEHGWQVANTSSYPVMFAVDRDNLIRPLAAADIALFEALSRALPAVLMHRRKLTKAWNGEKEFRWETTVDSIGDQVDVEMGAPYPFKIGYASKVDPSDTTMIQLAVLAHTAGQPSSEIHNELCHDLLNLFEQSPEGKKRPDGSSMLMPFFDFAFGYEMATIATLQAGSVEEIVFNIVPRKVMVPPEDARSIIEEYRLFYRFLKRQYALPQADHCLKVLGGNAIKRLKAALADDSGFGIGKGLIAGGVLPDFDPDLMPPGLLFDDFGMMPVDSIPAGKGKPSDDREKKKKRKAAKKARKKNR